MNHLKPGERLEIGQRVQVGNLRGTVSGHLEPKDFNGVVAHVICYNERAKVVLSNRVKWFPIKPTKKPCNYAFISPLP